MIRRLTKYLFGGYYPEIIGVVTSIDYPTSITIDNRITLNATGIPVLLDTGIPGFRLGDSVATYHYKKGKLQFIFNTTFKQAMNKCNG